MGKPCSGVLKPLSEVPDHEGLSPLGLWKINVLDVIPAIPTSTVQFGACAAYVTLRHIPQLQAANGQPHEFQKISHCCGLLSFSDWSVCLSCRIRARVLLLILCFTTGTFEDQIRERSDRELEHTALLQLLPRTQKLFFTCRGNVIVTDSGFGMFTLSASSAAEFSTCLLYAWYVHISQVDAKKDPFEFFDIEGSEKLQIRERICTEANVLF